MLISLDNYRSSQNLNHYVPKSTLKPASVSFAFSEPTFKKSDISLARKSLHKLNESKEVDFTFDRKFSIQAYQERFTAKKLNKQLYRAISDIKTTINFEMYTPGSKDMKLFERFIRKIKNQIGLGVIKIKIASPEDLHRIQDFLNNCFGEQRHKKIRLEICIDLNFRFTQIIHSWFNYFQKFGTNFCKGIHKAYFIQKDFLEADCLPQIFQIISKLDSSNDHFTYSLLTSDKDEVESATTELRALNDFMKVLKNPRISIDLRENGCSLGGDHLIEVSPYCENLTFELQNKTEPQHIKIQGELKHLRVLRLDIRGSENWNHCNNIVSAAPALEELELISTDESFQFFEALNKVLKTVSRSNLFKSLDLQLLANFNHYEPDVFSNLYDIKGLRTLNLRIDYNKRKSEEFEEVEECKLTDDIHSSKTHTNFLEDVLVRLQQVKTLTSFAFEAEKAGGGCIPLLLDVIQSNKGLERVKLTLLNPSVHLSDFEELIEVCRKTLPMNGSLEIELLKQKKTYFKDVIDEVFETTGIVKSYSLTECTVRVCYRDFSTDIGLF